MQSAVPILLIFIDGSVRHKHTLNTVLSYNTVTECTCPKYNTLKYRKYKNFRTAVPSTYGMRLVGQGTGVRKLTDTTDVWACTQRCPSSM